MSVTHRPQMTHLLTPEITNDTVIHVSCKFNSTQIYTHILTVLSDNDTASEIYLNYVLSLGRGSMSK